MRKELCVKLVIYKNYTEMHGQQNINYFDVVDFPNWQEDIEVLGDRPIVSQVQNLGVRPEG